MADLPKGHWIHAAMAKEKARVGKKKGNAGAGGKSASKTPGMAPMGNGQPGVSVNNSSGDGYGPGSEHQRGNPSGYTC